MLDAIWSLKVQIIPVMLAFALFQIPSMLHKIKKEYYIPIYFSVFPFNLMNQSLSKYLVEDFIGEDMTDAQAESYRKKFIIISTVSVSISILVIPAITGFIGAFFLTIENLIHVLVAMSIYKIVSVIRSILNFHRHAIATITNRVFLSFIYFFYVGMVIYIIHSAYYWTFPFVEKEDWLGLLSSISDFIFGTIGLKGIMIVIVTIAFTSLISDRKVRKENLKSIGSWKAESND